RPRELARLPASAEDLLARPQVPEPDRSVRASRGEVPAIGGAKRHAEDVAPVAGKRLDHLAAAHVPDLHGPVPARGGDLFAVRAERQAVNLGRVAKDDRFDPAEPLE